MHYTEDGNKSISSKNNKPSNEKLLEEKHKQDIISFKTNQASYLLTLVQMETKLKNQKKEIFKPVCLYLFKSSDGFKLRFEQKSKGQMISFSQKECIQELHISLTQTQLAQEQQMSLEEKNTKAKKKTINVRFSNKFVRFRWFTMLQNLKYFLNGNKNKDQFKVFAKQLNLTLPFQGLQPKKILFQLQGPYYKCREEAKSSQYHILPIQFNKNVYYVAYGQFKHVQYKKQRMGCLLILYEHYKVIYFAIAYSNSDYLRLSQSSVKKEQIKHRYKNQELIHIQQIKLSQLQWNSADSKQIKFNFGKNAVEVFVPHLRDTWHIFLLNNKYNKQVEPAIHSTFQIFKEFKKEKQSMEAIQGLFSANTSQYKPIEKQQQKKQPKKKQKRKNNQQGQRKQLSKSISQNGSKFISLEQSKQIKGNEKIIKQLRQQNQELCSLVIELLNQGFVKSVLFDMSKSHLSKQSISYIQKNLNYNSFISQESKSWIRKNISYIKIAEREQEIIQLEEPMNSQIQQKYQKEQISFSLKQQQSQSRITLEPPVKKSQKKQPNVLQENQSRKESKDMSSISFNLKYEDACQDYRIKEEVENANNKSPSLKK